MRTIIVTGSTGLIGSESVKRFAREGTRVVGMDNDMREKFFGAEASTKKTRDDLIANVRGYEHHDIDIRDADGIISRRLPHWPRARRHRAAWISLLPHDLRRERSNLSDLRL